VLLYLADAAREGVAVTLVRYRCLPAPMEKHSAGIGRLMPSGPGPHDSRRSRRRTRRVAAAALALALGLVASPPRALAQEALEMTVLPETVSVTRSEMTDVEVVVKNLHTDQAQDLLLTWFPSRGVEVSTSETMLANLPAGDFHAFRIAVGQSGRGTLPGKVTFKITYRFAGETITRFASAPLSIESTTLESVSSVASLEIRTTLASLSEQRPGTLYLLVSNKSDVPVTLAEVSWRVPEFVTLTAADPIPITVAPGMTRIVKFDVTAGGALQPGKHLIVINGLFEWRTADKTLSGNLVASQEASVEVFGESAILGLIAVPAVLLLPGALIVLTFALGLAWRSKKDELPVDPKTPMFWVIAVPLSVLVAVIYPWLGGQNYLLAYNLGDLVVLWIVSTLTGAIAFFAWWGAEATYRHLTVPKATDDERTVLAKLKRRQSRVYRPRVKVKDDAGEVGAFLLERRVRLGTAWVGPRILLEFAPDSPVRDAVERQLTRSGRVRDVVSLIDRPDAKVNTRFEVNGAGIPRPTLASKVTESGEEELIFAVRTV
jgi:hypothetical protein